MHITFYIIKFFDLYYIFFYNYPIILINNQQISFNILYFFYNFNYFKPNKLASKFQKI